MIEIKNVETMGFSSALRGMRNPYESFSKADSGKCTPENRRGCIGCGQQMIDASCLSSNFAMGMSDTKLAHKLVKAGPEHRKFLRMIHVQADVKAPRRWWSEFDTYRFVEKNSSSTMHLITKRHLTIEDFSHNKFSRLALLKTIGDINDMIDVYNTTDDAVETEEAIDDDTTPLASPSETIDDDGTPLASGKHEDCWVHWLMLLGMILSTVYFVGVSVRRRKFTSSLLGYEDKVLGNDRDNA